MKYLFILFILVVEIYAGVLDSYSLGFNKIKNLTSIQYGRRSTLDKSIQHDYFFDNGIGVLAGFGDEELFHFENKSSNIKYKYVKTGISYRYIELIYKKPIDTKLAHYYEGDRKVHPFFGVNIFVPISYRNKFFIIPYVSYFNKPSFVYLGYDSAWYTTDDSSVNIGLKIGISW